MSEVKNLTEQAKRYGSLTVTLNVDDVTALLQRAEAAEAKIAEVEQQKAQWVTWAKEGCAEADRLKAKLAELETQEPYAYAYRFKGKQGLSFRKLDIDKCDSRIMPLFTRPAPAINLADLLPDNALRELDGVIHWINGLPIPTKSATKWLIKMSDLRDTILCNIEEQSQ